MILPSRLMLRSGRERRYHRGIERVEERLGSVVGGAPGLLGAACAMTLDAGGKRLRPLLTLMCARSDRDLEGRVLHAAVAVELLHMATLVHDDVLDRADLRRGSPTVARAFGSMTALSTGNLLLARAFSEIARTGDAEAVEVLSAAAVALSEGEVMQRDQARDLSLTQPEYERRCERKTADLFSVSCRLGSRLSGMEEKAISALAEYGRLIGLAFQIFDDILDCSGDAASTGKIPGADVRDGTMTLPLMFALEAEPWLSEVLSKEEPGADEVATVLRTVATSGALERAWSVAMRYIEAALTIVETCPGPVERDLLAQVAAQVVARHR